MKRVFLRPSQLLLATAASLLFAWPSLAQTTPVVLSAEPSTAPGRRALASADADIADPVREARRTLPQARKRYLAGLPSGDQCLLMVRVVEGDTLFRPVTARVIGWQGGAVQALLPARADSSLPPTGDKIPVSFPESAVLDWIIVRANGREEGNYVGRYLETAQQIEDLPFR
jgi:hypothetical protein